MFINFSVGNRKDKLLNKIICIPEKFSHEENDENIERGKITSKFRERLPRS